MYTHRLIHYHLIPTYVVYPHIQCCAFGLGIRMSVVRQSSLLETVIKTIN